MEYPKISVIIVVYNGEGSIRRSVGSVIGQTFDGWELVIVDDGSTDATASIIDGLASDDERIRCVHTPNGGVSKARQTGLDNARGEYVTYIDADDWIDADTLECLYATAAREDADMVICDLMLEDKTSVRSRQQPTALDAATVQRDLFLDLHGSCCNKLVRRRLFGDFEVAFPAGINMREDLFVNVCLLNHDIKVAYVPEPFYHYEKQTSATSLVKAKGKEDQYRMVQQQLAARLIPIVDERNRTLCRYYFANRMVLQAFNSRYYSSSQFRTHYHQYALDALRYPGATLQKRVLLFLSCIGLYGMAKWLSEFRAQYR
ncbi:MAG: glycosyltransferase family 2 protein [Bacteroidaceae bacterium]|nr:glycosyltransferase family 2 protein [Bacteroidaceae bacterium]